MPANVWVYSAIEMNRICECVVIGVTSSVAKPRRWGGSCVLIIRSVSTSKREMKKDDLILVIKRMTVNRRRLPIDEISGREMRRFLAEPLHQFDSPIASTS